jgi:hypothetical protein
MIDRDVLCAFTEKVADMIIGPRSKSAPVTAAGAFVGTKGGAEEVQGFLRKHKSFQKARAEYQKANPDVFITLAFKTENPPSRGGFLGIGGDKHYSAKLKAYRARKASPRVFIREGEPASYAQKALYREVDRGLYDGELNKPWLSEEERAVWT